MTKEENETIICINDADATEGFFKFGTSKQCHFRRLLKYVNQSDLEIREHRSKGVTTWWDCRDRIFSPENLLGKWICQ